MAFHSTWTEITPKEALKVWNTHAVFAYSEDLKVDWQINDDKDSRGAYQIIDEQVQNGALLFVENN